MDDGGRGRSEGDARKRRGTLDCIFFLRIKSCGFRRDSSQPSFLSISKNFLCFFLWPGLLLSFFCKRKFFRQSAGVGGETPETFEAWKEAVLVVVAGAMATLDATRAELAFLVMYLNKAETRDKICRAIQYGSKFLSNGEPGVAAQVDKTTSLARKVFRLAKVGKKSRASLSRPSLPAVLFLILSQLQLSVLSSIASSPSKQRSFLPELIDEN